MRRFLIPLLAGAVVFILVVGVVTMLFSGSSDKTATLRFTEAVGLFKGSGVRILGVEVGKVTSVRPEGTSVRVTLKYKSSVKVPANATAVIVPPSVVADRYVQFTPVYTGGPVLPNKAFLDTDRTMVPVELDQIYRSLDDMLKALGPEGANKNGALSRLLKVSAANLQGEGQNLHDTVTNLSDAVGTLSDNRDNLAAVITNLQQFTTTVANSDQQVRALNRDLADVSEQLDGEKGALAAALHNLSIALGEVATFVQNNKDNLTADIADLGTVTNTITKDQRDLIEVIDSAPQGLTNLVNGSNLQTPALDTRNDANPASAGCLAQTNPVSGVSCGQQLFCQLILGAVPPATLDTAVSQILGRPVVNSSPKNICGGKITTPTGVLQLRAGSLPDLLNRTPLGNLVLPPPPAPAPKPAAPAPGGSTLPSIPRVP